MSRPTRKPRPGFNKGFGQTNLDSSPNDVHEAVLKNARKSGVLNISQRGLETIPEKIWTMLEDVPEESRGVSMDNDNDKWWERTDLTKLIVASNQITFIDDRLEKFGALTVLDAHDNRLTSLPKTIGKLENLKKLDVSHNQLTEIPPQIGSLHQLVSLLIDHNKLTDVTEEMCSLKELELLNISNNEMSALPLYICLLSRLKSLNISHNKLKSLPPDIGSLNGLVALDATHNSLTALPDELGSLAKLEQLHLRHNNLQYLPVLRHCSKLKEILVGNNSIRGLKKEHIEPLSSLITLDIRDNKLEKLPDEITVLEKLERLDLTNNDISILPYTLGTMSNLKAVTLDGNPMRSIRRDIVMRGTNELKKYLVSRLSEPEVAMCEPQTKSNMPGSSTEVKAHDLYQMKVLDYSNKQLSEVPDDVVKAALEAGVKNINLSKNMLSSFPENLTVLTPIITELNLSQNRMTSLSGQIGLFTKLNMLNLRINGLSDLPSEIASLVSLREIALSNCRFTSIPSVIYKLPNLEILFVNDNRIATIDVPSLLTLTKLGTLDLQNNDISRVPPELGNMTWLKSLQLSGNPCRNPRPALLTKGTPAILEYLRSRIVT